MRLFLEEGFENVTIRKISHHIEYSPSSIYLYFKDKNDIFYHLYEDAFEKLVAFQQQRELIAEPLERLRKHGRIYFDFALKYPEYYDLMFIMRKPTQHRSQEEVKQTTYQMLDLLRNDVQACLARNGNRQSDAEATTLAIWSAWHGLAALLVRRRLQWMGTDQVNTLIDKVLEMSLEGVKVVINIDGNIPQVPYYRRYYLSHLTPHGRMEATMIPPSFEYFRPTTLSEAISLLQKHGENAKILAGGHSLIPMMKLRLATPPMLIDINRLDGLSYIKESGGFLRIGALTRESDLDASDLIRSKYPIIADTAKVIADPLVRNMATVGGNLAHADPANDHPATMVALGAEVVVTGAKGERTIPINQFFTGLFETALKQDEILTEIRVRTPGGRTGGAYFKLERKVGDFAVAAVAVQLTLDTSDKIEKVGIGLTNVGPTVIQAKEAEELLRGKKPDDDLMGKAGDLAAKASQPSSDLRGPAEYKRAMVKTLTVRALNQAVERAKGGK
ncbi:MAG: FAD binding domain-containing protein [Ignavibacteriales bacterium]|nr:FAD binding domain-containing protein [Ignavibacteriales bacterium]